jgi:hypothetical protein
MFGGNCATRPAGTTGDRDAVVNATLLRGETDGSEARADVARELRVIEPPDAGGNTFPYFLSRLAIY